MKILFITPQLPFPLHQGTTIRNFNLIRYLAHRHEIDLLTFAPSSSASAKLDEKRALISDNPLKQLCRRIELVEEPERTIGIRALDTLRSRLPDMALRLESSHMRQTINQIVSAIQRQERPLYDIVQIEGIEVAQYGMQFVDNIPQSIRPILAFDNHNCEYLLQKRNALTDLRQPRRWIGAGYSLIQWRKLSAYEAQVCRMANITTVVSPNDGKALSEIVPELNPIVVSNGIDLEAYSIIHDRVIPENRFDHKTVHRLVFVGKMDYRPNVDAVLWFGHEVLPKLQHSVPNVEFVIVGQNPHSRLDELRTNPAVVITGWVEDPRPYIETASVYVIPLRVGGGTRFKALEAMAVGQAIVSTSLGIEGIPIQSGQEMILADEPGSFVSAIVTLLKDRESSGELCSTLGQHARKFVSEHYDWAQIVPRFEQAYERVIQHSA
ncbi:glycosyltransferase [Chloroflexi bacterium TSY]|nr:glycosyltransferase [Chloroflexi bacterium TSY]